MGRGPGESPVWSRRQLLRAAAGALLAAGCRGVHLEREAPEIDPGEYAGPPLELSFWNGFTGGDGPVMSELVRAFNARQQRIRVVMNALRWDDFYRKALVATFAGSGPDVGVVHQHRLAAFADRGVLAGLDALLPSAGLSEGDFFPPVWRGGIYREKRYGIPLDVHLLGMYLSRSAFLRAGIHDPPADAQQLVEALARLQRSGVEQPFWIPTQWPAHLIFASLLWQFGGAPFSADAKRVTFASEAGQRAIGFLTSMLERGYSPRAVGLDAQWNAFVNGSNAVLWDGSWMLQNMHDVSGGVWVAPFPQIGEQRAVWGNAHQLVLFAKRELAPERVKASLTFLRFLTEQGLTWAKAGMLPARTALLHGAALKAHPATYALVESLPALRLLPQGPAIGELQDDILQHAVDASLRAHHPIQRLSFAQRLASDELVALRAPFER